LDYTSLSFLKGQWPPFTKSIFKTRRVLKSLSYSHNQAYDTIKKIDPKAKIGFSKLTDYFEPAKKWCLLEIFFSKIFHYFWNKYFFNLIKNKFDFIGLNYYFHGRIIWYPPFRKNLNNKITDTGWEIYPKGIYYALKYLSEYKKPIYITENGLADADDKNRKDFIVNHLKSIHKATKEGINVRGYFHWSLIDNYEWDKEFKPRFGLIEIDYKNNLKRIPRPSSKIYAKICKENIIKV